MAFATDFYADQARRQQDDEDAYIAAQRRENAAGDTRKASLATLKTLNSGLYPLISADPQRAPASGYNGARDYYQGLDDQRTIASHNGGAVRFGGTVAQRPSLAALRGGDEDPNDFTRRNNAGGDIAPTYEQQRQGRILSGMDARIERQLEDERRSNNVAFDLGSGAAAARTRGVGDIQRDEALQDARQGSTIYEDPAVSRTREAQFADEMRRIRARYTDPAVVRGQAEIEAARTRGAAGVERQGSINQGLEALQGLRNQGAEGAAGIRGNAQIGAAVAGAGGDPAPYAPAPTQGPAIGARRIINGQRLKWDGRGWLPDTGQ